MTDADLFHAALDLRPDDHAARWLLAEFLAERGDPDAVRYRWMGRTGACPLLTDVDLWTWFRESEYGRSWLPWGNLIDSIYDRLTGWCERPYHGCWKSYPTRRDAEQALCRAVAAMKEAESNK